MATYTTISDELERLAWSLQHAAEQADAIVSMCVQHTSAGWDCKYSLGNRTRGVQAKVEEALRQLSGIADLAMRHARSEVWHERFSA